MTTFKVFAGKKNSQTTTICKIGFIHVWSILFRKINYLKPKTHKHVIRVVKMKNKLISGQI